MFVFDAVFTTLCILGGFGFLVFVHELGHFLAMLAVRCSVEEFSVGFGKELYGKTIGQVRWKISWIPLGGYVRALEKPRDSSEEADQRERLELYGRSRREVKEMIQEKNYLEDLSGLRQFFVFAMGPAFSFLLGWVLLAGVYGTWGSKDFIYPLRVTLIQDSTTANASNLQNEDTIEKVNGFSVSSMSDLVLAANRGDKDRISIEFTRDGIPHTTSFPRHSRSGITHLGIAFEHKSSVHKPWQAISKSLKDSLNSFYDVFRMLGLMSNGEISPRISSGPVGITNIFYQVRNSPADFLRLLALLSINLCSFNLLPIPFLDGGKMCFGLAKCFIRRSTRSPLQERVMIASILLLAVLFLAITISDIARLFGV
jgi:regulator of sigma E protease